MRGLISKPAILKAFEHVRRWCEAHRKKPIILGIQPAANGALWAAEAFQLPAVHLLLAPNVILSRSKPPAPLKWSVPSYLPAHEQVKITEEILKREERRLSRKPYICELEAMRLGYGLDPIINLSIGSIFSDRMSHVGLWPEWYAEPADDWPENLKLSDFPTFGETQRNTWPIVDKFIDKFGPPVVLTFGTGVRDTMSLLTSITKAQSDLNCPMIFVGGNARDAISNDAGPSLHLDFVEFDYLFPKAKLIIHHGGIGTLAQAVRAKVPQLIRPTSFDQFDNAERVKALALGDYLMPNEFMGPRIANKIRALEASKITKNAIGYFMSAEPHKEPFDVVLDAIRVELRCKELLS